MKALSLILLVVGGILLFYGFQSRDSIASTVNESITGSPTDRTLWLIGLGVAGVLFGGLGLLKKRSG